MSILVVNKLYNMLSFGGVKLQGRQRQSENNFFLNSFYFDFFCFFIFKTKKMCYNLSIIYNIL